MEQNGKNNCAEQDIPYTSSSSGGAHRKASHKRSKGGKSRVWEKVVLGYHRVATTQGKQGIWLLTFPDRENTGNLVNLIFYTGNIVATQGKF